MDLAGCRARNPRARIGPGSRATRGAGRRQIGATRADFHSGFFR